MDLVIFDCDGVLVDSERLSVRIESELLGELGWPLSPDEVRERFLGRSDAYMLGEIERELGRPVPEWDERYRLRRDEVFATDLRPVEGVGAALDALAIATCVASSGTHPKIRRSLELTGLAPYFGERIFSATDVDHGKPAPDLFLLAASGCGAEPRRCVVVEDSPVGVAAASAAGMRSLGYAGGITPASALAEATAVFDDMAELGGLIARWH